MSGVTKSFEKLNAREVLVSSDVMRLQTLASRDDQDLQGAMARSIDASPTNPNGPGALLQILGSPISGLDVVPTFTAAAGFTATLGAGAGFLYDPGLAGLTTDDSAYLVTRWPSQVVTFTTPDGTHPRIDLVVATPAMVDTDLQSRNILVDPVARTVTPQNVFKTSNPVATVSVVAGTPAATPVPPAVPTGALGVMYCYVPAAAGSAASFSQARAAWRRAPYPFAAMSGVIAGMGLKWDLTADPTAASAGFIAKGFHRIVIDGETMEFYANIDSTAGGVLPDTANNPFTSAATATWHKPYYLYAVGGRRNPLPSWNTSDGILSPVTIVESLTPPNLATGKPTAAMTVNGVTVSVDGAVYIGLGFVVANSTRRAACLMNGAFTMLGGAIQNTTNRLSHTSGTANYEAFDVGAPAVVPAISTKALVNLIAGGVASIWGVAPDRGDGTAVSPQFVSGQIVGESSSATSLLVNGQVTWPAGSVPPKIWVQSSAGSGVSDLNFLGYDHGVRLFGASVNP